MMKIEFSTSGAAFYDEYADNFVNKETERQETIRILKDIISKLEVYIVRYPIMDINGNKIGEWRLD